MPSLLKKFDDNFTAPARYEKSKPKSPPKPRPWQGNAAAIVDRYSRHPRRVELWQNYRPFTLDALNRFYLGVGVLPSCRCKHERLVYPVWDSGRIVGLRGRAITCDCAKWLQSAGSTARLWTSHTPTNEKTGIVCESPVDGMFAWQETPGIVTVASTCGAGTWKDEWTKYLKTVFVSVVRWVVWLDNDLPGQAMGATRQKLLIQWKKEHPNAKTTPKANGPRICNNLLREGLRAILYRWPATSPPKMDLSAQLMLGR